VNSTSTPPGGFTDLLKSRTGIALLVFVGIAAFFLITEHTAHFFGVLPYLLLLACPIMMLFMHGGHGGHGGDGNGHADDSSHQSSGGSN
jgi:hypothetical protein